jgi:dTDP-4-dehydrorhamnose reductase
VRLTKVVGPEDRLLTTWRKRLKSGEAINPFSDMVMSPVALSSVVSSLKLIIDKRLRGIFQLSGDRDITYGQAANFGADVLGADGRRLVRPIKASEAGYAYPIPAHTTLNTERTRDMLGIKLPDVFSVIREVFAEITANEESA